MSSPALPSLPEHVTSLAVALGVGLLVGLERERRKGVGPARQAAGLRTFTVAALAGALSLMLSDWLAAAALVGVASLASLSYWRDRSDDPGLTTELALLTTTLIGMLANAHPELAAGCGVVLAAVLAARNRLHHFATQWLTESELHDVLLLSALSLVLLPLLPTEPLAWLGHLSPRRMLWLVIVMLLVQGAGHVALRVLGPRAGLALSGLLGGFVSSTATIGSMAGLARDGRVPRAAAWSGAVLSSAATWLQVMVMASVVAPQALPALWPMALIGAAVPLALGSLAVCRVRAQADAASWSAPSQALRLREAVLVTALLVVAALIVSQSARMGQWGLMAGTALAALADAHAPLAGLVALYQAGEIDAGRLQAGVAVAISVNACTRSAVAYAAGGLAFGASMAVAFAANLGVVWLAWSLGLL